MKPQLVTNNSDRLWLKLIVLLVVMKFAITTTATLSYAYSLAPSSRLNMGNPQNRSTVPSPFLHREVRGRESIYRFIANLIAHKEQTGQGRKAILIGFGGISGARKTVFTAGLSVFLNKERIKNAQIPMDWFLKDKSDRDNETERLIKNGQPVPDEGPILFDLELLRGFMREMDEFNRSSDISKTFVLHNAYNRDNGKKDLTARITIDKETTVIFEGVHALREEFLGYYDFPFLISASPQVALQGIKKREREKGIELRKPDEFLERRFEIFSIPFSVALEERLLREAKVDFLIDINLKDNPVLREVGFSGAPPGGLPGKILSEDEVALHADIMRRHILETSYKRKSGHIGGSFSMAEVFSLLYFGGILRYDSADPQWSNRDRIVVSEGHIAPIVYATLASAGFFPMNEFTDTFREFGSRLQGHPDATVTPGIDASTGSLGEGLSIASGIATVRRLKMDNGFTYVVIGDGDSQKGQHDEAARFCAAHGLSNIIAVLNHNRFQYDGGTSEVDIPDFEDHKKLWEGRGWNVVGVKDGHDIHQLNLAFDEAKLMSRRSGRPTIIIAETIKGRGVSFMENTHEWHGRVPDNEEYSTALREIDSRIVGRYRQLFSGQNAKGIQDALRKWNSYLAGRLQESHEGLGRLKGPIDDSLRQSEKEVGAALDIARQTRLRHDADLHDRFSAAIDRKYTVGETEALRNVFGEAILAIAHRNPNRYLVASADTSKSVATGLFREIFGNGGRDRRGYYIPCGVRESHMASWAYGVALAGKIPVIAVFENFSAILFHQVKPIFQNGLPLKIIVTHTGLGVGHDGKSHQSVVELGMFYTLGIPVFEPADPQEARELLELAFGEEYKDKPVLIRLTRQSLPVMDRRDGLNYDPQKGFGIIYEPRLAYPDKTVTIVAAGAAVHEAVEASRVLKQKNIKARVIAINQLNKVAPTGLREQGERLRLQRKAAKELVSMIDGNEVYTVHDAAESILRGVVTTAIATEGSRIRLAASLGIRGMGESGTPEELYRKHGLDAESIIAFIEDGDGGQKD